MCGISSISLKFSYKPNSVVTTFVAKRGKRGYIHYVSEWKEFKICFILRNKTIYHLCISTLNWDRISSRDKICFRHNMTPFSYSEKIALIPSNNQFIVCWDLNSFKYSLLWILSILSASEKKWMLDLLLNFLEINPVVYLTNAPLSKLPLHQGMLQETTECSDAVLIVHWSFFIVQALAKRLN